MDWKNLIDLILNSIEIIGVFIAIIIGLVISKVMELRKEKEELSDAIVDLDNELETNGILKNQVIVTTHAQEFVEDVDIENINVIKKGKDGTKKSRIDIEKYDFKELQKLKIELIYKNAEMFFADKVILVEGEEYILIPKIVEHVYEKKYIEQ